MNALCGPTGKRKIIRALAAMRAQVRMDSRALPACCRARSQLAGSVSESLSENALSAVRTAEALRRQAGLYPNPMVGYSGDEINGGSVFN